MYGTLIERTLQNDPNFENCPYELLLVEGCDEAWAWIRLSQKDSFKGSFKGSMRVLLSQRVQVLV